MSELKLKWQNREKFPSPTNPLQRLRETLSFTSRDCGDDKMVAFMYAIINGWDNGSYQELSDKHGWSAVDIDRMKEWCHQYERAWMCWNILRTMSDEQLVSMERQVDAILEDGLGSIVGVNIGPELPF